MNARAQAQQYRQTAVSSAVLDADPHRLVALMLTGIRERLQLASACMQSGDNERKGRAINDASRIIEQLNGSLDHTAGGEIADSLGSLYDYSQRRLVEANLRNDSGILQEVDGLIADIESAWQGIAPA